MDKSGLNINKERYFETFVHIKFKSYYWYGSLYAEYAKQQQHWQTPTHLTTTQNWPLAG